jgi:hypothetical protein
MRLLKAPPLSFRVSREQKRQTRRLTPADFLFGSIQQGDFVTHSNEIRMPKPNFA